MNQISRVRRWSEYRSQLSAAEPLQNSAKRLDPPLADLCLRSSSFELLEKQEHWRRQFWIVVVNQRPEVHVCRPMDVRAGVIAPYLPFRSAQRLKILRRVH